MKRLICSLMALVLVMSFCGCKPDSNSLTSGYKKSEDIPVYDFTSGEDIMPENYSDYTAGTTDFAFDLLATVADGEANVVVSPLSASSALSLLANGAADSTRKEIRNVIASGVSLEDVNAGIHYLNSRLAAFNTKDASITSANSLWLDDSFDVRSAFLQTAVNYYDTEIQRILLSEENALETINNWIASKTDNEITDAVGDISEDAVMLIVNALLMDDAWATPYTETAVSDGTFHGVSGDMEAAFMTSKEYYLETAYAKGFTKSFENLPLKFAAVMPCEGTDMETFLSNMTSSRWQSLLDSQQSTGFCYASLPQFEVKTKLDLTEHLKEMGMELCFSSEKADFSSLSNSGSVFVSKVSQDAFIEIGPQGARAGAATVVSVDTYGISPNPEEVKELLFDQPFVFVIYDNESGIPVFTGVVNNVGQANNE